MHFYVTTKIERETMKPTDQELAGRFGYHHPNEQAVRMHIIINTSVLEFAKALRDVIPEGRELDLALTALEEVRMRANQGIAISYSTRDQLAV